MQIAVPVTYETRMFYLRLSRALTRVKICLPCRTATVKHAFLVWAGRGETCFRMHEFGTGMKFARTVSGNTKVTDSILRTRMHSSCKTLTKILELPRYSTHWRVGGAISHHIHYRWSSTWLTLHMILPLTINPPHEAWAATITMMRLRRPTGTTKLTNGSDPRLRRACPPPPPGADFSGGGGIGETAEKRVGE